MLSPINQVLLPSALASDLVRLGLQAKKLCPRSGKLEGERKTMRAVDFQLCHSPPAGIW